MIRPGRVDMKLALSHADEEQIRSLFLNFYPESSEVLASKFASQVADAKLSMAHIQGHFLLNKNNPQSAIAGAAALIKHAQTAL